MRSHRIDRMRVYVVMLREFLFSMSAQRQLAYREERK